MMGPRCGLHLGGTSKGALLQLSLVVLCDTVNSRGCMSAASSPQALEVAFSVLRQPVSSHLYPHS